MWGPIPRPRFPFRRAPMPVRALVAAAALACAPALHAQAPALQPDVLFPATDTMYVVRTAGGAADTAAVTVQALRRIRHGGRDAWEVAYAYLRPGQPAITDTTTFDAGTLLPIAQRRSAGERRTEAAYRGREVRIRVHPPGDGPGESAQTFEEPVFAGSLMDLVFRALPLQDGYRTRIPFLVLGANAVGSYDVRVTGPAVVETRDGPVAAWRVQAGAEGAWDVLWIARDSRVLLRVDHADGSVTLR